MLLLQPLLMGVALFTTTSFAIPADPPTRTQPRASCNSPALRKEWSAATARERTAYTKAVICLTTKKSRIGLPTSLYDDFSWVHNQLGMRIHGTAQFFPWHRYFIHLYEQALKQCGYSGVAMYWDWVADSAAPEKAKIWSNVDGFGGNGTDLARDSYTRCIDGPFKNITVAYKGNDTIPHCIERQFADAHPEAGLQALIGWMYNADVINTAMTNNNYLSFHPAIEGSPHGAVHAGIAGRDGDMGPLTSPNDPIFFLHHTQVDRLWWIWQQANPANRTNDFGGLEYGNVPGTLNTIMKMLAFAPDRKVGDFMSTTTTDLCYKY